MLLYYSMKNVNVNFCWICHTNYFDNNILILIGLEIRLLGRRNSRYHQLGTFQWDIDNKHGSHKKKDTRTER